MMIVRVCCVLGGNRVTMAAVLREAKAINAGLVVFQLNYAVACIAGFARDTAVLAGMK